MDEDTTIPKVTTRRKRQIRSDPPANAVKHDEQKQESTTKRNKKSPAKGSKRKPETPALPIDQESLEVKEVQKATIVFFQLHSRLA